MTPPRPRESAKATWRKTILAERAEVSPHQRLDEARALAESVVSLPMVRSGDSVCAYVPVGTEPGSSTMLDALVEADVHVLLPVVPGRPGPLEWATYTGADNLAVNGKLRLAEPTGQRAAPTAIKDVAAVFVPALAVDYDGIRLGRGGGYYDRTLPLADSNAALIAIVRDSEVVPRLPAEEHDKRVTATLTPASGFVPLPR